MTIAERLNLASPFVKERFHYNKTVGTKMQIVKNHTEFPRNTSPIKIILTNVSKLLFHVLLFEKHTNAENMSK